MSGLRLFDSDWYDGMAEVADREWSEADAQAAADGTGETRAEEAWAAVCRAEFPGAGVPVDDGGSGLGLGPVLEIAAAAGAGLFPTRMAFESLLPSLVLRPLAHLAPARELLSALAAGRRVAVAITDDAAPAGGGPVFVHGAATAPACLVIRHDPATLLVAGADQLGEMTELRVLDGRELTLVDVTAVDGDVLVDGAQAEGIADQARWLGALLAAADALGAASTALHRAILYAGQRRQFGAAIGSFQAIKHAIVDRYLDLQIGRALLASASAGDDVDPASAAMATAGINLASVEAVNTAIQVHGAIGFTMELGLHLYQRRALVDRELFVGTGPALAVVRQSLGVEHQADPGPQPLSVGAQR
jgi:alkylation response protein AidB-like acyl-CoA dehydrogenase